MARERNGTILISVAMVLLGIGGALGLATLLARPILRLVEGTRAIAAGDFKVSLPVTSGDEIGALTDAFNQMAKSLREKEMIKHAFARYVAREVVEELLRDPERLVLTGERREVTVLFCDLRGFTRLAENLKPEESRPPAERLLRAHDRGHLPPRGNARQVPGRRRHGRLRRAGPPGGPLDPRHPDGPGHAGGHQGVERPAAPRRQATARGGDRGQHGRGGRGDVGPRSGWSTRSSATA